MINRNLLLLSLTFFVCGQFTPSPRVRQKEPFLVNVMQSSYQAKENGNVTLEWTFTTIASRPPAPLHIHCELLTDRNPACIFHLEKGVEVPEYRDKQFAGRVQCDKDLLREGQLRLHVSRLRIADSGAYRCEVFTNYGGNIRQCQLSVVEEASVQLNNVTPSQRTTTFQCSLGLTLPSLLISLAIWQSCL